MKKHKVLADFFDSIKQNARLKAYLESDRCQAFNENGIFRHYAELDE